jgi:cytochrome c
MMSAVMRASIRRAIVVATVLVSAGCRRGADGVVLVPGGDATRGERDVVAFGGGACHTIDGLRGAHGTVGPPLTGIGARSMIAGQLPNTPANLVRWLLDPPGVEPGTAMPKLVNDGQTARDIAAYLYTLR